MGTITHNFDAGQAVWVITSGSCPSAVRGGTVIQVRALQLITGVTITYDIRLDGDKGTTVILEVDMFATLADATTEYEIRLT